MTAKQGSRCILAMKGALSAEHIRIVSEVAVVGVGLCFWGVLRCKQVKIDTRWMVNRIY